MCHLSPIEKIGPEYGTTNSENWLQPNSRCDPTSRAVGSLADLAAKWRPATLAQWRGQRLDQGNETSAIAILSNQIGSSRHGWAFK